MSTRRLTLSLGRAVAVLAVCLCVLGLALAAASTVWPALETFDHLTLHLLGGLGASCLAAASRRPLSTLTSGCFAVLAAPALYAAAHGPWAAASARAPSLTILSHNILFVNEDDAGLERSIRRADADIVVLTEYDAGRSGLLARLSALYPHQIDCAAPLMDKFNAACDVAVLSKTPPLNARAGVEDGVRLVAAEFKHRGRGFTLFATHLPPPLSDLMSLWRRRPPRLRHGEAMARLSRIVGAAQGPVIVAGDFNATPWSRTARAFQAGAGVRLLGGWAPTWPATFAAPQLPIDHFFASPQIAGRVSLAPAAGSDHYALLGRFDL
ncbi:MAG: endonuclease/exonuclease/phosphatase family protein [Hyphomicrobiales bacterium]|nr:endonuclease/exonuclease/phosphatase family protein [Hyphomicrobiales bacterium]